MKNFLSTLGALLVFAAILGYGFLYRAWYVQRNALIRSAFSGHNDIETIRARWSVSQPNIDLIVADAQLKEEIASAKALIDCLHHKPFILLPYERETIDKANGIISTDNIELNQDEAAIAPRRR